MAKELSLSQSIYGIDTSSNDHSSMSSNMSTATPFQSGGSVGHYKGGPLQTGTTIVAVQYKDGVILGADTRSSVSAQFVANRFTDKLHHLTDNIFVLRSGSSADTQNVADYVQHYLNNLSQELDEPPRVRTAAHLIQSILYANKDHFSASMIIAGWDKYEGGQIYACPLGGTLAKRVPYALGGSGSSYIYGYIDANFKSTTAEHKEARTFVKQAISHAIFRDGSSGGLVRTVSITKNGLFRETNEPFPVGPQPPKQEKQ
eukprot:CAMPEP_0197025160 /NCGR_PEP_ID=MMETSP1384-20130603/5575_1 /TAXON_ID=29189 /ORGANISM="Ammonia sp." /LENGTH=258 /DNA_ID=CAMNT_0042453653 /DNA_START=50 /DNA_END=826 /DNA_ORIENTATION=+